LAGYAGRIFDAEALKFYEADHIRLGLIQMAEQAIH
jgi:hypothetical protein